MRELLKNMIDIEEIKKFKWLYLYTFLFFIFIYLIISIKFDNYINITIFSFIFLSTCIFVEYRFSKEILLFIRILHKIMTSPISIFLYSLIYSYLISYIYESYIEITGIINPLFVTYAFVPNVFILFSTLFLIYFLFFIYLTSLVLFICSTFNFLKLISINNFFRFFNSIVIIYLVLTLSIFISDKYKKRDTVNSIIISFLYDYQYFSNDIGNGRYICKNLTTKNINIDRLNLERSRIKEIKVYPLFSEDKVSYVVRLEDDNKKFSYKFDIVECDNN